MTEVLQPGDEYTCAECGGVFEAVRPHGEAIAEAEEIFGDVIKTEETSIVCDDCWKAIMEKHSL